MRWYAVVPGRRLVVTKSKYFYLYDFPFYGYELTFIFFFILFNGFFLFSVGIYREKAFISYYKSNVEFMTSDLYIVKKKNQIEPNYKNLRLILALNIRLIKFYAMEANDWK